MHSSFPNWYRSSRVKPDGERLKKAWKVVVGLQKKLGGPDLFEAVAWALDLGPTEDWPAELTSQVVKIDPSFASEDRRHEVAVLAVSAVLARIADDVQAENDENKALALATRCGSLRGRRKCRFVPELVPEAEAYLVAAARLTRQRPPNKAELSPPKKLAEHFQAIRDQPGTPEAQEALQSCLTHLEDHAARQELHFAAELRRLDHLVSMQSEETEMLWWLLAGRSAHRSKGKIQRGAMALKLGDELAGMTVETPGPPSVPDLLRVAMKDLGVKPEEKVTLADAVNEIDPDWAAKLRQPEEGIIAALCPLSTAVRCSLEGSGKEDWFGRFQKLTGTDPQTSLALIDVTCQLYDEQLLIKMREK